MFSRRFRPVSLSAFTLLWFAYAPSSLALANRVFVSARSGNNANSCDNINTPCQTFAGAILQLNPGGEAIVLDSGGYGPVTITQSVTIEASPGVTAFIHPPSGNAITVNAGPGDTVVLRGLVLNGGSGNGITVNTVGVLHVESCVIAGFTGSTTTQGNGIFFGSSGNLFVKDTIVRGNGWLAIWIKPGSGTVKASVDHCRFEGNADGPVSDANAATTVRDSVASGHLYEGFLAVGGGELNIENCVAANNGGGIFGQFLRRRRRPLSR